ncbi:MAG: alpha/beta hydrolase [Pseudomonadota bacterium]|nr:alpha/beta hydrolase [Pseudomonadota bacterium]
MGQSLWQLIGGTAVICLLFILYLWFAQEKLLYFPERSLLATPADASLPYEPVTLTTTDGVTIAAWLISSPEERGTILFCHGNAGNISHRLDTLAIFYRLGYSSLIFDYRGYGHSEGKPSEAGTYNDAGAAWNYLTATRQVAPEKVVLFGRSLGAAVAIHLARHHQSGGLIIESAFTSLPDLAADLYPLLPARTLCRFSYPVMVHLQHLSCPLLVIHSHGDEIVPFAHGRRLFAAAREPKTFLAIDGDHNTGFLAAGSDYVKGLETFLQGLATASGSGILSHDS